MKYDNAIYIGRFQPFHTAHYETVKEALKLAWRVTVVIGSCNEAPSEKNPWSGDMRTKMIRNTLTEEENERVDVRQIIDYPYNDTKWISQVMQLVDPKDKTCIIGYEKDASSYYLKVFPFKHEVLPQFGDINATNIREDLYEHGLSYANHAGGTFLTDGTLEVLSFNSLEDEVYLQYKVAADSYSYNKRYREDWQAANNWAKMYGFDNAQFTPIFVTCDAVVVQSGHVLLIQRGQNPGKGQWALPGGFLEHNEHIKTGILRELKEETDINLQDEVLDRCLTLQKVYDDPNRSTRGRLITHVGLYKLNDQKDLPKVKGSDDAADAKWIPIDELKQEEMFSDHFHIIKDMLSHW